MAQDPVRKAADRLAGHAVTCRMQNTLEWMEQLSERLNEYLQAIESNARVQTAGHGFDVIHKTEQKA